MPFKSFEITPVQYYEQEIAQRSQLYKGFSTVNPSLADSKLYDYDLIKQDILNQFNTKRGERVMRPEFGSLIWDLLFEPFTMSVKTLISDDVNRIIAEDIRVTPININLVEAEYGLMMEITLRHNETNQIDTMRLRFDKTTGLNQE